MEAKTIDLIRGGELFWLTKAELDQIGRERLDYICIEEIPFSNRRDIIERLARQYGLDLDGREMIERLARQYGLDLEARIARRLSQQGAEGRYENEPSR